jgi:hypothetical protein
VSDATHARVESAAIDRREAIRRAALLAGVALSPRWLSLADRTLEAAQQRYLSADQDALVSAIAERILPKTDTPGAIDVGVPAFIDLLYGEFMSDDEKRTLVAGLAEVEAAARSAGGSFASLAPDRQDAVLRTVAGQEKDQPFWLLMRTTTILGYFTSEPVGRTVLHYDPIPGRYDPCVPIDSVGRRNWTT